MMQIIWLGNGTIPTGFLIRVGKVSKLAAQPLQATVWLVSEKGSSLWCSTAKMILLVFQTQKRYTHGTKSIVKRSKLNLF